MYCKLQSSSQYRTWLESVDPSSTHSPYNICQIWARTLDLHRSRFLARPKGCEFSFFIIYECSESVKCVTVNHELRKKKLVSCASNTPHICIYFHGASPLQIFMTRAHVWELLQQEHSFHNSFCHFFLGTYAPDFTASVLSNSIRILKIDLHGSESAQVRTYSVWYSAARYSTVQRNAGHNQLGLPYETHQHCIFVLVCRIPHYAERWR